MLMSMKMLKQLSIHRSWFQWLDVAFEADFHDRYPFQLEDFFVVNDFWGIDFANIENLKRFLKAQSNAIKTLDLGQELKTDEELWQIAFRMKSLKTLKLAFPPPTDFNRYAFKVPRNESIELLDLRTATAGYKVPLIEVLEATSNTKKLHMQFLDEDFRYYIPLKQPKLRLLAVHNRRCDCGLHNNV